MNESNINSNVLRNWKITAIILIVTTVFLGGLSTFLLIKNNKNDDAVFSAQEALENCKTTQATADCDLKNNAPEIDINEDFARTFTIEEWGIKFDMPTELENAKYYINGTNSVIFTTKAVEKLGSSCDLSKEIDNLTGGWLMRLVRVPVNEASSMPGGYTKIADDINGFAFYYQHPQSICGHSNETEETTNLVFRDTTLIQSMMITIGNK